MPGSEGSEIYTHENIHKYYHAPDGDNGLPSASRIYDVAGDICNVIPGVSNVKNGFQAAGYYALGAATDNVEAKEYYFANAIYKTFAIVAGDTVTWGDKAMKANVALSNGEMMLYRGAKAVDSYDKTMSWLGFSDDLLGFKTDEYFGPATLVIGVNHLVKDALYKTGDAFNKADVTLGDLIDFTTKETNRLVTDTAEGLDQIYGISDGVSEGMKWWLTVPQPLPGQSYIFINDPYNPLNMSIDDYGYTTANGTLDIDVLDIEDETDENNSDSRGDGLDKTEPSASGNNTQEIDPSETKPDEIETSETILEENDWVYEWIFNGTSLPKPETKGKITEWTEKDDSYTIRYDGMTYDEYIAYCTNLQALSGWEVYNGGYDEDVAHFPSDYNEQSKVYFTGSYGNLPHISVQYYSDEVVEKTGYPHVVIFVFVEW
jgi:hypothetical protein